VKNDIVGLARVNNQSLNSSVENALDLIGFKIKNKVDSVLIKANLCYYWDSVTGYTTDRRLVSSVIDTLRAKYGLQDADIKIVEADATAMKTCHVFKMLKYEELAREKRVTLKNLSEDDSVTKTVSVKGKGITLDFPKCLLNIDGKSLFVNMPKMKIMSHTIISCAMKNLFGCIATPRKIAYHPMLDETIVAANKVLKPDLTVVDGIVALSSSPVKMNLIISGVNTFSVDWTVARIMKYHHFWINHLQLARREGLGNPRDIALKGENLSALRKEWPHVNVFRLRWQNALQLKLLKAYSRIVGDVIPPFLET
jgi:uncharacterized protein (DUF362 family)